MRPANPRRKNADTRRTDGAVSRTIGPRRATAKVTPAHMACT